MANKQQNDLHFVGDDSLGNHEYAAAPPSSTEDPHVLKVTTKAEMSSIGPVPPPPVIHAVVTVPSSVPPSGG